jgi:hypothetical protein
MVALHRVKCNKAKGVRLWVMSASRRTELLERLNTLDAGPTEDDRRAEREATISKAVQTAEALAREGRSAGGLWGFFGRAPTYR